MSSVEVESFCDVGKTLIEQRLEALIPTGSELPYYTLFEATRYSLLSTAKRLRPLLVLATASLYGVEPEYAIDPACALEMLHTYSLIHDDLPCMDDDDFRRGRLTLHKVYPESHAVLAGDYLLTLAFDVMSQAQALSDTQRLKLVQLLSQHAGAHGLIGGQMIDLLSENQQIDLPTLEMMHSYKTASLIVAALEFGAIIGNAPEKDLLTLHQVGRKVGVAFQIVDDTLDLTGSFEELGKQAGADPAHNKATALSVMTLEQCTEYAHQLLDSALNDLMTLSQDTSLLSTLLYKLVQRHK